MVRSPAQWLEIFQKKDRKQIAKVVLGDLTHYRHDGAYEEDDQTQIMNAMVAYFHLLQGTKV